MISVVIPTLNAETGLAATLSALVPAAVDGLVREVIVVDGGSTDGTLAIADDAGAQVVAGTAAGRGPQLRLGGERARQKWLLFLHADTVLEAGWEAHAHRFMDAVEGGERPQAAAVFRFRTDDVGLQPRLLEFGVAFRNLAFALPYGDQGLLLPRRLYDEIGGYRPLELMEDVDIVRRLGRRRLVRLSARAVTSAARYKRDGYARRSLKNLLCLASYFVGVSPSRISRFYR